MVLYYTGTGNSRYCAEYIAERIDDRTVDLFDYIRYEKPLELHSDRSYVLVCPTYCWQIPHVVRDLISSSRLTGSRKLYTIMTCGDDTGNAGAYVSALCAKTALEYMGTAAVVMPENYIAMFNSPSDDEARRIIQAASPALEKAAGAILAHECFERLPVSPADRIKSAFVNDLFYLIFIKDKAFTVSSSCISCGSCERQCPMGNISLSGGKPTWSGRCIHCMACITVCPAKAIEYGKKSVGRNKYNAAKVLL